MRILLIVLMTSILMFFVGWSLYAYLHKTVPSEVVQEATQVVTRPLEKYSIENLQKATWQSGNFKIEKQIADEKEYTSYLFTFTFNPEVEGNKKAKTTGQINIPKGEGPFPIVLMFRGYVDQTMYSTGTGTRPAASYFAKNGYITIAPDFLGYAGSDSEAGNIFESRFQTYTTAVSLLKTIERFKDYPNLVSGSDQVSKLLTNYPSLSIWGHSNGGQIALTTLSITGANYPTTLWAPASKPFPYVVLYFTDESDDGGKFIRKELGKFEDLYDVNKYSYTNYLDTINAPIQLHQGTSDDAVPIAWSNTLVIQLKQKGKDVTYITYPGADHNLRPRWDDVVAKDVEFFKKHN